MSPQSIVRNALEKKLDIIAVSDHNSAENVAAVMDAAARTPLTVFPAMEIASREEVHILSIFPDLDSAKAIQNWLYDDLPDSDDPSYFQEQVLANGEDEVEGFCTKLLIMATRFSINKIVSKIHELQGAAIAAHIDRQSFGIIGQLGFIPLQIPFDALEVSAHMRLADAPTRFPDYAHYPFITNSDSHYLKDIGRVHTELFMHEPTFLNILDALKNRNGCHVGAGG